MSILTRRGTLLGTASLLPAWTAGAQTPASTNVRTKPLKIGIMSDMSGPYAEASGPGDVVAARLAIEDFGKQHPDIKVELIAGDMLLKPDVGAGMARDWYDQQGVDAIFDIPQSAVALAVGSIAKEKDKVVVFTSAGLTDITGKYCTPNQIQWTYDLWANANSVVEGLLAAGADTWYFILIDIVSGYGMTNDAAAAVKRLGGRELGRVAYPFPQTTDFSSQLLQAKASGAKVICLANAGDDTANCLKQAHEFGMMQSGLQFAALVMQDYIVRSVGLESAQDLVCTMPFVWNMNEASLAFSARFTPLYRGNKPNFYHAGSYSAVTHYLKAVAALGVDKAKASGRATVAQMKAIPVDDPLFGQGTVREDGKYVHTEYVWQTKTMAESKGPWDFFKKAATIPADKAFKPMAEGGCPLVKI
jgi:branched-chain amino acid transport system substrate-binding protein